MIQTFRNKALRRFFEDDDRSKLHAEHVERIRTLLSFLDAAARIEDMQQPSFHLHLLRGEYAGFWAITVRANWRIIFRFENGDAFDVHYLDYH